MGLPIPRESLRLVGNEENQHGLLFKKDSPQPLPGARLGACAERSVGTCDLQVTPAGVSQRVSQGADASEPRVGPSSVDGQWS